MREVKKKSRLGRGIHSLIGMNVPVAHELPETSIEAQTPPIGETTGPTQDVPRGTPALLPIARIRPNPRQPRRTFDEAALGELAASIRSAGLLQPVTVRVAADGDYELIAGERRLRACKLAGLSEVPALIRAADELEQAQLALIENIQREDLNPIDRAEGYRVLVTEMGLNQSELAGRLGEDRSTIGHFMRLLDLQPAVRELVRAGALSLGHAKVLGSVADPAEQVRLANLVVGQSLSVRNLERILAGQPAPASPDAPPAPSAHLRDLEVNMSKQLGMRVQVKAGATKGKGRVVIHYTSLDEFDTLLSRIGVALDD